MNKSLLLIVTLCVNAMVILACDYSMSFCQTVALSYKPYSSLYYTIWWHCFYHCPISVCIFSQMPQVWVNSCDCVLCRFLYAMRMCDWLQYYRFKMSCVHFRWARKRNHRTQKSTVHWVINVFATIWKRSLIEPKPIELVNWWVCHYQRFVMHEMHRYNACASWTEVRIKQHSTRKWVKFLLETENQKCTIAVKRLNHK